MRDLKNPIIIGVLLAGLFLGCGAQVKPQKAPNFTLIDISGKKFSLNEFQGKVVVLDFWATWCTPCVLSVPEIEKLNRDYKNRGVEVIGISLDQDLESIRSFVGYYQLNYRIAMANRDIELNYRIDGIPAFYIIDKNGFVVRSWGGYHPSLPEIWRREIEKLLKV